jgi:hypothetical protein
VAARAAEAAGATTGEGPGLTATAEPDSLEAEVAEQPAPLPVLAQQPPQSVPASPMLGRKRGPIQPPVPSFAAAHYVLDFGCIVKGTSRSRKFKLINPSTQPVSFKWDRATLDSWGIKVEPEIVSKLPGAPENGSMEVTLTLQAAKPQVREGGVRVRARISDSAYGPSHLRVKRGSAIGGL